MKNEFDLRVVPIFLIFSIFIFMGESHAASEIAKSPEIVLALEPARYAFVNGDAAQFRAHHWMSTGYSGGVKEFSLEDEFSEDTKLLAEGHAIPANGDYGGELKLTKEEWGYLLFEYQQFRKYYNSSGGLYGAFRDLASSDTDRYLALNIGEFSAEAGLRREDIPEITLNYTREFKQGTKSRLSWTSVTEGPTTAGVTPTSNILRKIGPSWQEVDEIVDRFDAKAEDELYGFHWNAEQGWEFVRSRNTREEQNLSNTATPASGSNADQKVRDQVTDIRAALITTILGLDKWSAKDKLFISSKYRFSQLNSRELENIFEYDQRGILTNFSNPEQVRDAHSDNLFTSNTWVANIVSLLLEPLSINSKFKMESIGRRSSSTYPKDSSPNNANGSSKPNGVIDTSDVSENQEKIANFGESISLRFHGLPRTAIYNEYEFQQTRSNLYEDRQSATAGEVFNRQSITHMRRASGVLGVHLVPWDMVTLTANARHREDDIRYNNVRYTQPTASGAKSVFIDGQAIETDELTSSIKLRPCRWFEPAFRYQFQNKGFETWGLPDSDNDQESGMTSHIYTIDVVIQPTNELLTTTSLSVQKAKVFTPSSLSTSSGDAHIPTYNADVLSFLFSAEYALKEDLVLTGLAQWSDAGDFNNLGGNISYGADYTQLDLSAGFRWTPKKDMVIEPKYSYYRYDPSPDLDLGGYNASVVSLDVQFTWG